MVHASRWALWPMVHLVADDRRPHGSGVDDRAVLHRGARAHDDPAVVAAQHRGRPDRRVGADGDRADDDRVGVHVGVGVDVGHLVARARRSASRQPSCSKRPYPPLKKSSGPVAVVAHVEGVHPAQHDDVVAGLERPTRASSRCGRGSRRCGASRGRGPGSTRRRRTCRSLLPAKIPDSSVLIVGRARSRRSARPPRSSATTRCDHRRRSRPAAGRATPRRTTRPRARRRSRRGRWR